MADRIAVLRDGRIVATVSSLEVHPDDVVAMISGVEADSTARRQLGACTAWSSSWPTWSRRAACR